MDQAQQIQEHMPVFDSQGEQFATVDHLDGDYIKLTKRDSPDGQHHWIPLHWIARVDEHVHIDRPRDLAMQEWLSAPPEQIQSTQGDMTNAAPY
jgi:hypothetical protein